MATAQPPRPHTPRQVCHGSTRALCAALCAAVALAGGCVGDRTADAPTGPTGEVAGHGSPIAPGEVRVVDGDTLDFAGWDAMLRLHGIDAPEEGHRAGCRAERDLAELATAYARDLLDSADAIRPDVGNPPARDRWGRYVGTVELTVDGARLDYGDTLTAAGYAKPWDYDGGERKPVWCG